MNKISRISALAIAITFAFGFTGPASALAAGPAAVNLGTAGNYVILSKTGVSTTGPTSIVGDIGLSPAAATYITGFGLILPVANPYSTSAMVTGKVYAPGYADPTASNLTTAVLDMQTAYTNAAGLSDSAVTELGAGNIGGLTVAPGLYKWGTGVMIPTDVTLSGGANDVWIFQIAQTLTVSSGAHIVLAGGAQPGNIFWIVAGQTTIGTTAVFNGNILDQTGIVLNTGATLNGRALAQTAVTLDANAVTMPANAVMVPPPTAVPTPIITPTPTSAPTPIYYAPASNDSGTFLSTGSYGSPVATNTAVTPVMETVNAPTPAPSTPPAPLLGQHIEMPTSNLERGAHGNDVSMLQQFLISQNTGTESQALAKVGQTAYFGYLTRSALAEFQAKAGITPAVGNFGPITRAYLSAHYQ